MNSEVTAILTSFVLFIVFGVLVIWHNASKAKKKAKKRA